MALTQSCQLYPTNFTLFMATFPRFHVNKVHLLNFGSSISFKKQYFCAIRDTESSNSIPTKNPQKKSNLYPKNKKNGWDPADSDSSKSGLVASRDSWLDNWNDTRKPNSGSGKRVVDYRNRGEFSDSDTEQGTSASTGGSTMERIVEKLKKFGYMDEVSDRDENVGKGIEKGSIEDIFYVEEGLLPNARGGFSEDFPFGDGNRVGRGNGEVRFPWEKNVSDEQKQSVDSRRSRSLAELTLPESELRRLKNLALRIKNKMRVTGAGVTQQVVETIREKWRTSEVVRLKIEGPSALNMKRMHEILERKTGGLVIWRSGTSISLYRGATYEDPILKFKKGVFRRNKIPDKSSSLIDKAGQDSSEHVSLSKTNASQEESVIINPDYRNTETSSENIYEDEINRLLDSLGPRYEDWPGDGPLPVDADLLPGVIPGYQPPFRLLPYGVRSTVGMKEATALRRLARVIPPHFALGRSRQHQGLAAAMIKLWERSSIAKIALKRGVQLTTSERMAEDLKRLTGGMLLSRNKDFLVFYRGKNFLTPEVAEALVEKERQAKDMQDEEEQARLRTLPLVTPSFTESDESGTGTLKETLEANTKWGKRLDNDHKEKVMREAEVLRHANLVRKLEKKLAFAERKLTKAERALSKVEESLNPADHTEDPESLTDEERFMFRKLGLRMKAFLLLGRRGIFGGTVENMHLHWKYRELVKIIVKAQNIEEVKNIALSLEAESGGVLVSVDKVSKGYAVVVFRGRDYKRPSALRPKNLLTKRKALARSIELQRREALLSHMSTLDARVRKLRSEIEKMATVEDNGDEELYNKLDSAYLSEDEESEEEDDSNDLEMYDSENDIVDTNDDSVSETFLETSFPYEYEDESDTEFAESK